MEIARIASRLPEAQASTLLWYARRLEEEGRRGPVSPSSPLAFPYLPVLGAVLVALLASGTDAAVNLARTGSLRLTFLANLSCVVAGISFLLLNTRMVQESVEAIPKSCGIAERAAAYRALRWRLWRPLLFCLPLAGILLVLLVAKWLR